MMISQNSVISLKNIVKTYPMAGGELRILQGINLDIQKGEMVAIMGPSGSGKTTLLNILGCLDRPTSGSYLLDGIEVSTLNRHELARVRGQKIGFIFQTFNLLSYMSALQNVELGLKYARQHDYAPAREALSRVGLADRVKHKPMELSGGERQRVAIARALVKNPPLILADEPTGNLDSRSGTEIMSLINKLNKEGITLIIVTHDPRISEYCRRVIHIMDGAIIRDEKK
jgi:putative ABC transport system ATP-binding protein